MSEEKYQHCFKNTELVRKIPYYLGKSLVAHDGELDADCSIGYHHISKPISFDEAHAHNFAEMLCFIGSDPDDVTSLGAEIEFTIGGETHLINQATVVSIPPNVEHCPIKVKKVDHPIVFLEVSLVRKWKPNKKPQKKSGATAKEEK